MKMKIFGLFVCMLLMTTAVITAAGLMTKKDISDSQLILDESRNIKTDKIIQDKPVNMEIFSKEDVIREYDFMNTKTEKTIRDEPDDPQKQEIKIGYYSIPATAFLPYDNDASWYNSGCVVYGFGAVFAPVYLPHEAEVEMMEYHWSDTDPYMDCGVMLCRSSFDIHYVEMADAWTSGSSGDGTSSDNTIDHPKIDNSLYTYYLYSAVGYDVWMYGITIRYNYEVRVNTIDSVQSDESEVYNK